MERDGYTRRRRLPRGRVIPALLLVRRPHALRYPSLHVVDVELELKLVAIGKHTTVTFWLNGVHCVLEGLEAPPFDDNTSDALQLVSLQVRTLFIRPTKEVYD